MSAKAKGSARERMVQRRRRNQGWVVYKSGGSLGAADLICLKRDQRAQMIQVKATEGGPYEHFRPEERLALKDEAHRAGADAILCWWPTSREGPRWLLPADWPEQRSSVATSD